MFDKKKRFSEQEIGLIKNTFKDQELLLISLRKFLLQGEMLPDEMKYLKAMVGKNDLIRILRKTLCPALDKGAPIGGTVDMFSGMDLNNTPVEHANLAIKSRKLAFKYLNQQFDNLEGKDKTEIVFDDLLNSDINPEQNYINFVTRNFILGWLDGPGGIIQLMILAHEGDTKEEAVEKLKRNSSK